MTPVLLRCLAILPVLIYVCCRMATVKTFTLGDGSGHIVYDYGRGARNKLTYMYDVVPTSSVNSVGAIGGNYITNQHKLLNCSSIQNITILGILGNGVSKQGYLGEYGGRKVVLKVIKKNGFDIAFCNSNFKRVFGTEEICQQFPRKKMMYEILMLHELSHPNIAKLLGYCVKGQHFDATDVRKEGLIVVTEFGQPVNEELKFEPWTRQLEYAIGLARLLVYFKNSPLGSICHSDYKAEHFKVFNSTLKAIDLDIIHNQETTCITSVNCPLSIECISGGCNGLNARRNLQSFQMTFSEFLFRPSNYPSMLRRDLISLNQSIAKYAINADLLLKQLIEIESKGLRLNN